MSSNTLPDLGWATLYGLEAYSPERPAVTEGPCAHPTFPEVRGRLLEHKNGCVWLLTPNGVTPAPAAGLCFVDPAAADARLVELTAANAAGIDDFLSRKIAETEAKIDEKTRLRAALDPNSARYSSEDHGLAVDLIALHCNLYDMQKRAERIHST